MNTPTLNLVKHPTLAFLLRINFTLLRHLYENICIIPKNPVSFLMSYANVPTEQITTSKASVSRSEQRVAALKEAHALLSASLNRLGRDRQRVGVVALFALLFLALMRCCSRASRLPASRQTCRRTRKRRVSQAALSAQASGRSRKSFR